MKINHVIKTLVISDFYLNAGLGVFAPIFAVFITKQITDGSLQVVGFAAAITQIFKSILEIPIANYLDKNHGEYDDFYSMILGNSIIAITPFLYLFASTAAHLYIIQAILGIGLAFGVPPWYAIFTRHIDKLHTNIEWSVVSVAVGIAGASSAALGGIIAERFGFNMVFIIGGLASIFGAIQGLKIFSDLKAKVRQGTVVPKV